MFYILQKSTNQLKCIAVECLICSHFCAFQQICALCIAFSAVHWLLPSTKSTHHIICYAAHISASVCVRVQFTPSCTNLCISNCTKTRSLLTCAICLMSTLCFIGDLCTAHCAVLSGKSVFIARPRLPKSSLHRYAAQKFAHDQVHAELRSSQGKSDDWGS